MEPTSIQIKISMLANGKMINAMDLEFIFKKMGKCKLDNGQKTSRPENSSLQMLKDQTLKTLCDGLFWRVNRLLCLHKL
jgi:hypothetical protein